MMAFEDGDTAGLAVFSLHLCPPIVFLKFTQQVLVLVVMSSIYTLIE